jgi:hypothetical protein
MLGHHGVNLLVDITPFSGSSRMNPVVLEQLIKLTV